MKTTLRLALAALVAGVAAPALAQTQSDTFAVTANVLQTCRLQNVLDLSFGDYDALTGTDVDAQTTFELRCNPGLAYQVQIDGGLSYGLATGYAAERAMTDGTNYLAYQLFQDAARTTPWGEALGVDTYDATAASAAWATIDIYGRIPTDQLVPAGGYTDATVTLTVNY